MKYRVEDIVPINIKDHLVENQEMYFGSKEANPEEISSSICKGAIILGANKVLIDSYKGWHYICGNIDWFKVKTIDKVNENNIFKTVWDFPEAGLNFFRWEVMSRIFSEATFSCSDNRITHTFGNIPKDFDLLKHIEFLGKWKRIIGFKFKKNV